MEVSELVDRLSGEGSTLAGAAAAAGLDASVPGCPEWVVRDLLAHVGMVHRWAAAIVGGGLADPEVDVEPAPADDDLLDWYRAGHRALVGTLRAAPADLECFTFLPAASPLAFWARRQALETAIHRSDAEGAAGVLTPIDPALAAVGMDELLNGFGARRKVFDPAVIRLQPEAVPAWFVTLGADGLAATTDDPGTPPDVTIAGHASEVYRWMWNRPADVTVTGDAAAAEQWKQIRVRWA